MVVDSTFRNTFVFLEKIGIFDVVLPFLLIFTIVYAMLDKTKVFGTEIGTDGKTYTKKNLNSLASFAISFFAVASGKVVEAVTKISANVVILLLASVFFLILVGSFSPQEEKPFYLEKGWRLFFMIIMFIGLVAIFLNAMESNGKTWLEIIIGTLSQFSSNVSVATIVLILLMVGGMMLVMGKGDKAVKT
jgi:hypothetical protein